MKMRELATELLGANPPDGKFLFAIHADLNGIELESQYFAHGWIEGEILVHVIAYALQELRPKRHWWQRR
jgi:hypothetical protein